MKLLTLNCHSWQENNQLEKIAILADDIAEKSYDVIALQEVSQLIDSDILHGLVKRDNYAVVLLDELKNAASPITHSPGTSPISATTFMRKASPS